MAYVRLDDSVMDNPKMLALSDRAFRGWVWGLCYAQRHLTDGFLPIAALTASVKRAASELQARGLWTVVDHGFQIHHYLRHQDSKADVEARKDRARDRMRERRSGERAPDVRANVSETSRAPSLHSLSLSRSGGEKDRDAILLERAGRLREELYPAWYAKFRHGARLRLISNSVEFQEAVTLCETWDDARLERLAQIVLTTDDPFVAGTDRSFKIFALKASWADDRLTQAERQAG